MKAHCLPRDSSQKEVSPLCTLPHAINIGNSKMEFSEQLLSVVVAVGPGFNSTSPAKSKRENKEKLETLMEA